MLPEKKRNKRKLARNKLVWSAAANLHLYFKIPILR